jgi:hypothetical protein
MYSSEKHYDVLLNENGWTDIPHSSPRPSTSRKRHSQYLQLIQTTQQHLHLWGQRPMNHGIQPRILQRAEVVDGQLRYQKRISEHWRNQVDWQCR